ncbi:BgTH12-05985 [Blumeria graminis f. sp. triticale]|uniref:BgTH12-05985 n=1 Tax=Blumeria graminis f. sp. triticale TaxID=1689686 RepID=A0A9W4D5I9_BLUGR|nr:BgTH12-05985 [Blumeria graminis f. sp. triticale]
MKAIYHRAACRQIYAQNLWNPNDVIIKVIPNLPTAIKSEKRHGSSVPGPLESRRRVGKRQIAYSFESIPTSYQSHWSWLKSFQEVDFSRWKWEPPRTYAKVTRQRTRVPAYPILSFDTLKEFASFSKVRQFVSRNIDYINKKLIIPLETNTAGTIELFLKTGHKLKKILNETIKQHILRNILNIKDLNTVKEQLGNKRLEFDFAEAPCSTHYREVWNSYTASITKKSSTIIPPTVIQMLEDLSGLSSTSEIQNLALSIVKAFPRWENGKVPLRIYRTLVMSWTLSWSQNTTVANFLSKDPFLNSKIEKSLSDAEAMVARVEQMGSKLQGNEGMDSRCDILGLVLETKTEIFSSLKAIESAENIMSPFKISTQSLAKFLTNLPRKMQKAILEDCSQELCKIIEKNESMNIMSLKRNWLYVISQIPALNHAEFLGLWNHMDSYGRSLPSNFYPELLLNRWASIEKSENNALVRNTLETTMLETEEVYGSWISLIYAIYHSDRKEVHFNKIGTIFRTLCARREIDSIKYIMLNISKINPRLPAEVVEFVVEAMTDLDPETAWNIAMISRIMKPGRKYRSDRYPRGDYRTLRYSRCPKFVTWMITETKLHPIHIWRILGVPIHAKYSPRYRNQPKTTPLDCHSEVLFKKMATAFAFCKRLPPRVALRNTMQCWHHLRHNKIPVDKTMAKALVHSGLVRYIENNSWVPRERIVWLLPIVANAEGLEVAQQVEQAVNAWNAEITNKKMKINRELNVLRTGIID